MKIVIIAFLIFVTSIKASQEIDIKQMYPLNQRISFVQSMKFVKYPEVSKFLSENYEL